MDGASIAGFVSIGVLVIINIGSFAYGYGKLNQKVNDHSERLTRIENALNNMPQRRVKAKSPQQ